MERAKILREIMNNKNLKISDISKSSGLAYSTVKYIFENGVENATYTKEILWFTRNVAKFVLH